MNKDSHIIFKRFDRGFNAHGEEIQDVRLVPVNRTLFSDRFNGWYRIVRQADGSANIHGWKQARSVHARRYESFSSEAAFEDSCIRWSNRIFQEEQRKPK